MFGLHKRSPTGQPEFERLCAELGIEHRPAPPVRPQTNGMVERFSWVSVYCKPRPVSDADLKLMHWIDKLHMESLFAGSRMMQGLLVEEVSKVGRR